MRVLTRFVILVLQILCGYLLGIVGAFVLGVGGWELVVMGAGCTLGVWGVGALARRQRGRSPSRPVHVGLLTTALGSALGVAVILLTPPAGFVQMIYPLIGALVGYYVGYYAVTMN